VQAASVVQAESRENELSSWAHVISTQKNAPASVETDLIAALEREKGQSDVMIERVADLVILTFPNDSSLIPARLV